MTSRSLGSFLVLLLVPLWPFSLRVFALDFKTPLGLGIGKEGLLVRFVHTTAIDHRQRNQTKVMDASHQGSALLLAQAVDYRPSEQLRPAHYTLAYQTVRTL